MTKKYARFLPTTESFTLEDFPYYWITQVHAQYVQNIDNALKGANPWSWYIAKTPSNFEI